MPTQVDTGRFLPWGALLPVIGDKREEELLKNPSRLWSPPQHSSQGLVRTVKPDTLVGGDSGLTWGLNCSRRRCGGRQRPDCSRDPREGPRRTP